MAVDINTAVDSLVKLVQKKGIIQIDEAANELGIPPAIVNEWAVFLEEEGVVGIEYKLTTPYIFYKKNLQTYQTERELIKKKLSLLLLSVQGKVPKTKKGVLQKNFLIASIQNLIKDAELINPTNKDKIIENIRKTLQRKAIFDECIRQGKL